MLPPAQCTDFSEWEWLIEAISDRFLWDDDYLYADKMLDAPPDSARRERRRLGITRGYYYLDDSPDPETVDIAAVRTRLKNLKRSPKPG